MAGLNKVQIIGNLGADPEAREVSGDRKVTNFRVAVNRRRRTAGRNHLVPGRGMGRVGGGLCPVSQERAQRLRRGTPADQRLGRPRWESPRARGDRRPRCAVSGQRERAKPRSLLGLETPDPVAAGIAASGHFFGQRPRCRRTLARSKPQE